MDDYRLPSISVEELGAWLGKGARLLDVRRRAAAEADGRMVEGALWADPEALGHGHPVLKGDPPLVFYCVHGHEVSQFAAALALVNGREAVYVTGGFAALMAAGVPLAAFEGSGA